MRQLDHAGLLCAEDPPQSVPVLSLRSNAVSRSYELRKGQIILLDFWHWTSERRFSRIVGETSTIICRITHQPKKRVIGCCSRMTVRGRAELPPPSTPALTGARRHHISPSTTQTWIPGSPPRCARLHPGMTNSRGGGPPPFQRWILREPPTPFVIPGQAQRSEARPWDPCLNGSCHARRLTGTATPITVQTWMPGSARPLRSRSARA